MEQLRHRPQPSRQQQTRPLELGAGGDPFGLEANAGTVQVIWGPLMDDLDGLFLHRWKLAFVQRLLVPIRDHAVLGIGSLTGCFFTCRWLV